MAGTEDPDRIQAVRSHVLERLGIDVLELYTPQEIAEGWLDSLVSRSPSVAAEELAMYLHDRYDLAWRYGNERCVVCGEPFTTLDPGVVGNRTVCSVTCLETLAIEVGLRLP